MQTKAEITNLIKPFVNTLKMASNEVKALLNYGIPEYLENQFEKYYYTNTFLHRSEKVKFYDIYFPVSVKYSKLFTKFERLEDVFDEYKYITLIGIAGSGKSTLVKYIFLSSIRQAYKIPILIELRHLNDYEGDLLGFISNKLLINEVKPSYEILKRALKKGDFLFLFDGYDEIFSKSKQRITTELETFVDQYPHNKYLISTRPGGGIEGVSRFHSFHVQDLSSDEIYEFIDLLVIDEERCKQIKENISETETSNYTDYLKNPLLLSMFILAFESHPEIPSRKSAFYRNVFDTLYSKHDGITKGSFPREKRTKLKREDFEEILSVFSFITFSEGEYAFTEGYLSDSLQKVKQIKRYFKYSNEDLIFDLRTSISILIKEGFEYKFPHRSMQEYFTALLLSDLPTEKKEKAYLKLYNVLSESATEENLNFWGLCKELDYNSYIKYLVLKELSKAHSLLKNKTGKKLLDSYCKINPPVILYNNNRESSNNWLIYRIYTLHNYIADNEQVYDYSTFRSFIVNTPTIKKELMNLFSEFKSEYRNGTIIPAYADEKIKNILLKHNICDVICLFINAIEEKIENLKREIEQRDDDLDFLLDS